MVVGNLFILMSLPNGHLKTAVQRQNTLHYKRHVVLQLLYHHCLGFEVGLCIAILDMSCPSITGPSSRERRAQYYGVKEQLVQQGVGTDRSNANPGRP